MAIPLDNSDITMRYNITVKWLPCGNKDFYKHGLPIVEFQNANNVINKMSHKLLRT